MYEGSYEKAGIKPANFLIYFINGIKISDKFRNPWECPCKTSILQS